MPGDNLTKISWLFGITVKQILQENDFVHKDSILSPGITLDIKPTKNAELLVDERFKKKIDPEEFITKM